MRSARPTLSDSGLADALCAVLVARAAVGGVVGVLMVAGFLAFGARGGAALSEVKLAPPACSTAVASAPMLHVKPSFLRVPGSPFGVVGASDGQVFVSLPRGGGGGSIGVLSSSRTGALRLHRVVPLSRLSTPYGLVLSNDGRTLYAADGFGLDALSVARLSRGSRGSALAEVEDHGAGPIYIERSKDGRYAFVSDEYSADISVFDLRKLPRRVALVGQIPVAAGPVGLARSRDGRYLFVTSELGGAAPGQGTLTVIDEAKALRTPRRSVVRRVDAGCAPVRVVLSPDGQQLWLTARGSNAVVSFSEAGLVSGSDTTPISVTHVGAAPVGLRFFDHGKMLAVADSNRFSEPTTSQTVAIVNVGGSVAGASDALVGYVVAGAFPREVAISARGAALYVTNFGSATVETIPTAALTG